MRPNPWHFPTVRKEKELAGARRITSLRWRPIKGCRDTPLSMSDQPPRRRRFALADWKSCMCWTGQKGREGWKCTMSREHGHLPDAPRVSLRDSCCRHCSSHWACLELRPLRLPRCVAPKRWVASDVTTAISTVPILTPSRTSPSPPSCLGGAPAPLVRCLLTKTRAAQQREELGPRIPRRIRFWPGAGVVWHRRREMG